MATIHHRRRLLWSNGLTISRLNRRIDQCYGRAKALPFGTRTPLVGALCQFDEGGYYYARTAA